MNGKLLNRSVEFFDAQFARQSADHEYALNPFETAVLPLLRGRVLDFGCGLGNLAVAAAQNGCNVIALDASPSAIEDLTTRSKQLGLRIDARVADLREYAIAEDYDCVVSIGLLMFFPRTAAIRGLEHILAAVRPGGVAAVNVLIEGTTFMDMFDPDSYYLFGERELADAFSAWAIENAKSESFPAPGNTIKRFLTIAATKAAT